MRTRRLLALVTLVAACDAYGSEERPSPAPDGGTGDASTADAGGDSGGSGDGGDAGPRAFIAVIGGRSSQDGPNGRGVYVAPINADGSLGTWVESTPLPFGRIRLGVAAVDRSLIAAGGTFSSDQGASAMLGTISDQGRIASWADGTPTPENRARNGLVAIGGRLYLIGGLVSGGALLTAVHSSAPSGGSIGLWTPMTSLPDGAANFGCATDGKHVFVVAGDRPGFATGSTVASSKSWVADVLSDGSLGSWRDLTDLGFKTSSNAAAATATHLYQAGGFAEASIKNVRAAAIQSDGSIGAWVSLSEPNQGRAIGAMVAARGHLYLLGGASDADVRYASVEMADIQADGSLSAWRETTPLPHTLAEHAATTFELP